MKKIKLIDKQGFDASTSTDFAAVPYSGEDCDWGVARKVGLVDPYTGNLSFETRDISLAGAVGRYGLSWSRVATSRESGHDLFFGQGHNWVHNWQWDLEIAGEGASAVATIREPSGAAYQFIQDANNEWKAVSPAVSHKLGVGGEGFVLRLLNGTQVRFAPSQEAGAFFATEVSDAQSNVWTLSYEEEGVLSQVTEPAGRTLSINYEALSLPTSDANFVVITQVTGSDGQKVTYHYEFPANVDYPVLSAVTYPDSTEASYTYAAPRPEDRPLLVSATDPHADRIIRGRLFVYRTEGDAAFGQLHEIRTLDSGRLFYRLEPAPENSPEDRLYAITLDNGAVTYQCYNAGGNLAETINGNGHSFKTEYASEGRGLRIAETNELGDVTGFKHDANGRLIKITFPDGSTRLQTWDDQGHLSSKTDELGNTATFRYDEKGNLISIRQPDGTTVGATYNDLGLVTSYTKPDGAVTRLNYDERGLLTQATNPLGGVSSYEYDTQDRVSTVTNPQGDITRYGRDSAGRTIQILTPDDAEVSLEYNSFGQVLYAVDSTGVKEYVKYDELGRQVERGRNNIPELRSEYAPIGSLAPADQPVKQVSATGRTVVMEYDSKGQLVARTTAADTPSSTTTCMTYDRAGCLIGETDAAGKTTRYDYDRRGRRIQITTALNHTTQMVYNGAGNKVRETDPNGNLTQWTYDSLGRELTKIDGNGEATTREYDAAGRLITLTDAKGNVHRFEYDLMGNQTVLIYPDGSKEGFTYDCAGLKLSFTNRAGAIRSFEYDNREREIKSEWNDGTQTVIKEYDAAGRTLLEDNGVSRVTYAYDSNGRLESQIQHISSIVSNGAFEPEPRAVTYIYNNDGERSTLGYPDGSVVNYEYEAHGWLSRILDKSNESLLANYEYDAVGNPTQIQRGNTIATTNLCDEESHIIAIIDGIAAQEPLSQLSYHYNEVGNRTELERILNGTEGGAEQTQEKYNYDPIYQVTGVESVQNDSSRQISSTLQFTYDASGNRVKVDESGVTIDYTSNTLNQYTQVGDFIPSYDANGNLGAIVDWAYQYDALSRLVSASNEKITAHFWYDARNRVIARSYQTADADKPTLTLNTYDDWNLIEERDESGIQTARYVHGPRIDEIVVMKNAHGAFYPHRDAIGSVTMLTDSEGKLAERYHYSVTGEVTIYDPSGTELSNSTIDNRWLFTGREWLSEIGLYDYRNRVYSPQLGRFLQTDPVRFQRGEVNLYIYVLNDFLNRIDPCGKDWLYYHVQPKQYQLGRDNTWIQPGAIIPAFIEDYVPAAHTFAVNHDDFVDFATGHGFPDFVVNIPSMLPVYVISVFEEIIDSIDSFIEWIWKKF